MIPPAEIYRQAIEAGFTERQAQHLQALLLLIFHELGQPDVCPECRRKLED